MLKPRNLIIVLLILAVVPSLIVSCAPVPETDTYVQQVTVLVPQTVVVTQLVEVVVTATPEPTPELPTTTPTPDVLQVKSGKEGFSAWCIPNEWYSSLNDVKESGIMPPGSREMTAVDDRFELIIQVAECDFLYSFNQPVPTGTKWTAYYSTGTMFMEQELVPLPADGTRAVVINQNPYVIDPPYWYIDYVFKITAPDGTELRSDNVRLKRGWDPGRCYQGAMPDPITLKCPEIGEGHPWDPWYGWDDPKPESEIP